MAIRFDDKKDLRHLFWESGAVVDPFSMTPYQFRYYFQPRFTRAGDDKPTKHCPIQAVAKWNDRRAKTGLLPMIAAEYAKWFKYQEGKHAAAK